MRNVVQVGNYIQHKGGVVTAEELAPYMDVPQAGKDPESVNVDESYVIVIIVIFLGNLLADPVNLYSLANSSLSFMIRLFPLLQV